MKRVKNSVGCRGDGWARGHQLFGDRNQSRRAQKCNENSSEHSATLTCMHAVFCSPRLPVFHYLDEATLDVCEVF